MKRIYYNTDIIPYVITTTTKNKKKFYFVESSFINFGRNAVPYKTVWVITKIKSNKENDVSLNKNKLISSLYIYLINFYCIYQ